MAKILIVDDDPLIVRMYEKKLVNDGYEVRTASDGIEALKNFESFVSEGFSPDIILLDIMMPNMNGLQVLEKLKANEKTDKIPVIMLTNIGGFEEDAEKALEMGAVAYLTKAGIRPAKVVSKIKEILAGYVREVPKAVPTN